MPPIFIRLILGLILSAVIGLVAYRRGSLTASGVAGAVIVGTAIFGAGGWAWGLTLIAFFVTSSLLSHYKEAAKEQIAEKFAKGHRRDLGQALANGGAGALVALGGALIPHPLWLAAFAGAMATVTADTWATELGVLARRPPRLVTTWRTVEAGTSGAISLPGTLAALAGSLVIGGVLGGLHVLEFQMMGARYVVPLPVIGVAALVGGMAGAMFDSLLGATVQAIYYSEGKRKETERAIEPDGTPNRLVRGWRWLGNDAVNFLCSLFGAGVAAMCSWLFSLSGY